MKAISGILIIFLLVFTDCKKDSPNPDAGILQIQKVQCGTEVLSAQEKTENIPIDLSFNISFSSPVDTNTVRSSVYLLNADNTEVNSQITFADNQQTIILSPIQNLDFLSDYSLSISNKIRGQQGEAFSGIIYSFSSLNGEMIIENINLNGKNFNPPALLKEVDRINASIIIDFSEALDPTNYQSFFSLTDSPGMNFSLSNENQRLTITVTSELTGYKQHFFNISSVLKAENGYSFKGFYNSFYTSVDPTPKFPLISDEALLSLVQEQTFKYFWDYAHPACGLARERYGSGDIVTTGGSGFGVMALIVGIERGFIARSEGLERMDKILNFLETCDRYHGVWPHWLNGSTGKVVPFSSNDNGADLVETAFMVQGLLTLRQYLNSNNADELLLINRITTLWEAVEWDWFARDGHTLYWHWSPDLEWVMNMQIRGVNETLISYILGVASPTHAISEDSYQKGYMQNGNVVNGESFYGYQLPVGADFGGPLFFTHYSFLGLDPRNLEDQYVNYWTQNTNHTLINRAYCIDNPKDYVGYGENAWGLTASDNESGYSAHSPTNDRGVITPTAALSSMPYTPTESMVALKYFYYTLGDKLWGPYGFYDAYNVTEAWWANSYLAIDQGPIIIMIENYRTQLLWDLFMSNTEIQNSLTTLGFTF